LKAALCRALNPSLSTESTEKSCPSMASTALRSFDLIASFIPTRLASAVGPLLAGAVEERPHPVETRQRQRSESPPAHTCTSRNAHSLSVALPALVRNWYGGPLRLNITPYPKVGLSGLSGDRLSGDRILSPLAGQRPRPPPFSANGRIFLPLSAPFLLQRILHRHGATSTERPSPECTKAAGRDLSRRAGPVECPP